MRGRVQRQRLRNGRCPAHPARLRSWPRHPRADQGATMDAAAGLQDLTFAPIRSPVDPICRFPPPPLRSQPSPRPAVARAPRRRRLPCLLHVRARKTTMLQPARSPGAWANASPKPARAALPPASPCASSASPRSWPPRAMTTHRRTSAPASLTEPACIPSCLASIWSQLHPLDPALGPACCFRPSRTPAPTGP